MAICTNNGYKRTGMLILLFFLVMMLVALTFDEPRVFSIFLTRSGTSELTVSSAPKEKSFIHPLNPRFYNIILEEEALVFEPCQDVKKTSSVHNSKIYLTDPVNWTYTVGDEIRVIVILYDDYGKRKYTGGDQLRATIENKVHKASAPCVVTDNTDGTQAVACEALWRGTSTINVTLAYTRETITSIYRVRRQVLATRNIYGMYKSRSYSEVTACHPNHTHLLKHTNYTTLCNMTYVNSGMPFYCGKPLNEHLICQDWQLVRTHQPYPKFQVTECEDILMKRGMRALKQTITVDIQDSNENRSLGSVIVKPHIPCTMYNLSRLWWSRAPTGFFYNGKWHLRNCHADALMYGAESQEGSCEAILQRLRGCLGINENESLQENDSLTCLRNRSLYIFGDSTSRAWYLVILKRFACQPITEKWQKEKWHKYAECYNKKIDFKAAWYPHAQPFFVGGSWDEVRYTLYSTSRRIDNIPRNKNAIVVIHLYMHIMAFHHNVFKERMEIIRKSVETFIRDNKQSIVMIKAPHSFEESPAGGFMLNDYFGYVYSKLLYDIFEGLHDRVVLLNNRDATIAQHVILNHPPENIINAMVDQMLSYACDK